MAEHMVTITAQWLCTSELDLPNNKIRRFEITPENTEIYEENIK